MRWGLQIFQKYRIHHKILGTKRITWSKFYIEDPQILCSSMQNLVAQVTWCLRFVFPAHEKFALRVYWDTVEV
jgi:hypothetical protein